MSDDSESNLIPFPVSPGSLSVDVLVIGDGVMGRLAALALAKAGRSVTMVGLESAPRNGIPKGASPYAGGMLAPISELAYAEPEVALAGLDSVARWSTILAAHSDIAEVTGLAKCQPTPGHTIHLAHRPEWPLLDELVDRVTRAGHADAIRVLDHEQLANALPTLEGRFERGLEIRGEGSVAPQSVMYQLREQLTLANVEFLYARGEPGPPTTTHADNVDAQLVIDARGLGAALDLPLRGVRGEFVEVRTSSVSLPHPIRLAHPRFPLYIVPRADQHFYVGATQLESESTDRPSVRSVLELLSALHSVHPAFGDAEVVATGSALRPAMPDNLPILQRDGHIIRANGLFRHGYLLAPLLAEAVVAMSEDRAIPNAAVPFLREAPCAS